MKGPGRVPERTPKGPRPDPAATSEGFGGRRSRFGDASYSVFKERSLVSIIWTVAGSKREVCILFGFGREVIGLGNGRSVGGGRYAVRSGRSVGDASIRTLVRGMCAGRRCRHPAGDDHTTAKF